MTQRTTEFSQSTTEKTYYSSKFDYLSGLDVKETFYFYKLKKINQLISEKNEAQTGKVVVK